MNKLKVLYWVIFDKHFRQIAYRDINKGFQDWKLRDINENEVWMHEMNQHFYHMSNYQENISWFQFIYLILSASKVRIKND